MSTTSNTWNATRKLLATALPATPQGVPMTTNIYDTCEWLARTIQNPGSSVSATTLFTNDDAQRLISVTDPINRTTRIGYDQVGRQIAATNAANEVTRQFWSKRGELKTSRDGANRQVDYFYDAAGNRTWLWNRNAKWWQFQFDAANRLTNTLSPLNRQTWQVWNNRGLLHTVREPSGQWTTKFYDPKGRLTNITDAVSVRHYRYDANDNLTSITNVGQASRLSWGYDAYDRVTAFTNADGYVVGYRYDANGNLTNLIYPGNRVVTYTYDSLNRLTNVTDWAQRKTSFEYDLASRLKKIIRPNGTVREINYDAAGQTTNVVEKLTNNFPIAFFKLGWTNTGRVAWEFAAPLPKPHTPPSRTMTFDDDSRLLTVNGQSVSHDLDGNMTYGPGTNNSFLTYTYDARNRLVNVGQASPPVSISYGYDPAGNRIALTNAGVVTRFIINPNAPLSQVLMGIRPGVTNYYIYGMGLLYEVTETATSTNTLTYHYDYRGSTVALSDDAGNVTDRIEYSAYGTISYRTGNTDTPFLFNGRYGVQTDPNGLLYMRARYYNPYLCRFLNPDPAGFAGGLNFYVYADGNPVSLIDPFGLCAVDEGVGNSWLSTAWNVTKGVGLIGAGFVPWLGDAIEAYTVVAPGSSGLVRALSGASLTANAWTAGVLPNIGPIKRGIGMIGDAFSGAAKSGATLADDLAAAATRARNTVGRR